MAEKKHQYHNTAQERLMHLVLLLAGHEADGLSTSEIAKALRVNAPVVVRDIWNMQHTGWCEELPTGRYRLGPKAVQIALAYQRGLAQLRARADEIEQRYTRAPK